MTRIGSAFRAELMPGRADRLTCLENRRDAFERRRIAGCQEHRGETFIHEVSFQNLFHCPSILALA